MPTLPPYGMRMCENLNLDFNLHLEPTGVSQLHCNYSKACQKKKVYSLHVPHYAIPAPSTDLAKLQTEAQAKSCSS